MHFCDAFEAPGEQVEVEFAYPLWRGVLLPEVSGDSSPLPAGYVLRAEERGYGPQSLPLWVGYVTRLRVVADLLGGEIKAETHRKFLSGEERHTVTYVGPQMEV